MCSRKGRAGEKTCASVRFAATFADLGEITTAVPKHVEEVEDDRSRRAFLPLLEQLKPGYALTIERNDLTIQNG